VTLPPTDGAISWHAANTGLPTDSLTFVVALAIDPRTPTTLYAVSYNASVFKSTDQQVVAACSGDWDAGGSVTIADAASRFLGQTPRRH
jgi:hypothetical protein